MKFIRKFGAGDFNLALLKRSDSVLVDGLSLSTRRFILMEQVHSDHIEIVTEEYCRADTSKPIAGADGLITVEKSIFLTIKTADCIPLFLWDEKRNVIAALHSGRKGTELNIAGKAIAVLKDSFGCRSDNIQAESGPAICAKCYAVDRQIFADFVHKTGVQQTFPFLDLKKVIHSQLQKAGIMNIIDHQICTKEDQRYFSYRQNGTAARQISVIGMMRS